MVNRDVAEGKFDQYKGDIKSKWGDLTDDDYKQAEGDSDKLAGIIQEKFGHAKEEVKDGLDKLFNRDKK
jgi:uncharacterized protein YjbJ (UPF0337 family)